MSERERLAANKRVREAMSPGEPVYCQSDGPRVYGEVVAIGARVKVRWRTRPPVSPGGKSAGKNSKAYEPRQFEQTGAGWRLRPLDKRE